MVAATFKSMQGSLLEATYGFSDQMVGTLPEASTLPQSRWTFLHRHFACSCQGYWPKREIRCLAPLLRMPKQAQMESLTERLPGCFGQAVDVSLPAAAYGTRREQERARICVPLCLITRTLVAPLHVMSNETPRLPPHLTPN